MVDKVVAKFKVQRVEQQQSNNEPYINVFMHAVYGEGKENKEWSKYTPSGNIQMTITNKNVLDFFQVDQEYFVNFEKTT